MHRQCRRGQDKGKKRLPTGGKGGLTPQAAWASLKIVQVSLLSRPRQRGKWPSGSALAPKSAPTVFGHGNARIERERVLRAAPGIGKGGGPSGAVAGAFATRKGFFGKGRERPTSSSVAPNQDGVPPMPAKKKTGAGPFAAAEGEGRRRRPLFPGRDGSAMARAGRPHLRKRTAKKSPSPAFDRGGSIENKLVRPGIFGWSPALKSEGEKCKAVIIPLGGGKKGKAGNPLRQSRRGGLPIRRCPKKGEKRACPAGFAFQKGGLSSTSSKLYYGPVPAL